MPLSRPQAFSVANEVSNKLCGLSLVPNSMTITLITPRHMARDEMEEITEDKWDEDFWGPARSGSGIPTPRLIFYFGKDDHWVANRTRDELIAARGYQAGSKDQWKARMLIDDEDVPHAFCIRQCRFKTICGWILTK